MSDGGISATPSYAANIYARVQAGDSATAASATDEATGGSGQGFGAVLGDALAGVVESGHAADGATIQAISGHGDLTQVVTAVSRAQLALQTTTVIRDRVVSAYQDVMRMAI